jgi:predicted RNA-binding protein with PUA-like domain
MAPQTGWLFKTEPATYSYEDLETSGGTTWDGVANNQALGFLKQVKKGDRVLVYHTGDEKSVVGLARVTREAYPDPKGGEARLVVVDLAPEGKLPRPVTLKSLKARPELATFPLVRLPRLSVMPVTASEWKLVMEMAGAK